ncbi:MAG: hypothetical protein GXX85_13285 [Ignavibacteria bacterium]|nr:hypothetical protein [Ignavibacteria bacterium]
MPIFDTYSIKAGEKSIVTPYFLIEQNANYKKLVKFHPDQEFDVSVFQLEGSAHIEDATGKVGTELTNVKMPIFVVPAENFVNLAEATEVLVTVKVAREKLIKTIENPEIIYEYTSEQISPSNLVNNTTETITLPDFTTDPKGCNTVVVEKPKNDCKEPIVECGDDWKQTEITEDNFIILHPGDVWKATNKYGKIIEKMIEKPVPCTTFGSTGLTSYFLGENGVYMTFDDIQINPCLDAKNNDWNINFSNIRVPIITYSCNDEAYRDLGDCTNDELLKEYITDCYSYKYISDKINFDIIGTYTPQEFPIDGSLFGFSPGIIEHEKQHIEDNISAIKDELNKIIIDETSMQKINKTDFNCAENVIEYFKEKNLLQNKLLKIIATQRQILDKRYGITEFEYNPEFYILVSYLESKGYSVKDNKLRVPNTELRADKRASSKFKEIKGNLKKWAQTKDYLSECYNYEGE